MYFILFLKVFMVRRIHNLLTDFISQMPHKVKEMRLRAEDTDRTIHAYMHVSIILFSELFYFKRFSPVAAHFEQFLLIKILFKSEIAEHGEIL